MADRNQVKVAAPADIADDDPFAELTRIMGFDPRQPVKPLSTPNSATVSESDAQAEAAPVAATATAAAPATTASADDDFDIDLEKELMGAFDADPDPDEMEPAAAAIQAEPANAVADAGTASVAEASEVEASPEVLREADVAESDHISEMDFDLADGFDEAFAASVADELNDDTPELVAEPEAIADREAKAAPDSAPEATAVATADPQPEAVSEPETVADATAAPETEAVSEPEPELLLDFEMDDLIDDLDDASKAVEDAPQAVEAEPVAEAAPVAAAPAHQVDKVAEDFEAAFADVDMDFSSDLAGPEPVVAELVDDEPVEDTVAEEQAAVADDDLLFDEAAFAAELDAGLGEVEAVAAPIEDDQVEPDYAVDALPPEEAVQPEETGQPEQVLQPEAYDMAAAPVEAEPELEPFDMDAELSKLLAKGAEPMATAGDADASMMADELDIGLDEQDLAAADDGYAADGSTYQADGPSGYGADERPIEVAPEEQPAAVADADEFVPDFDHDAFDAAMASGLEPVADDDVSEPIAGDESMSGGAPANGKIDPLDEIFALTEKYSVPLPKFSRATPVAPPPPSFSAQRQSHAEQQEAAEQQYAADQRYYAAEASYAADTQVPAGPAFQAGSYEEVPDIETVEVADAAVALADDLDIPELVFEDDVPPVSDYDDLDSEFSNLLTELNGPQAQEAKPAMPAASYAEPVADPYAVDPAGAYVNGAVAAGFSDEQAIDVGYAEPDAGRYEFDADDLAGNRAGVDDRYAAEDYDFDQGVEDMLALPPEVPAAASLSRPPRRGMMAAMIVGGVAVLGGIGAFALSFDGGGDDVPVIVKADDSPIKVKPANPGGSTVPNQDNKVYDTVAGGGAVEEPQQEKLVTTAEEPIDMTPPASEAMADEDMDAMATMAEDETGAAPAKGEDRIEQILAEADADPDAQVAAVAPRRVRTLVVKPDGTLVPREDPEPAAVEAPPMPEPAAVEAPAEETLAAAAPAATAAAEPQTTDSVPTYTPPAGNATVSVKQPAQPAAAPARQAVAAAPQAPASDEITSSMPDTVPVAPQRPAEQPVNVVGEVKPDKVAAISGSARAGGTWAMQIASQPSEAAAQTSYQDLARRYSNVLGGREVNIVRAEIPGKGTFWRVRVPTQSRNEAVSLCETYKTAGGNCFVSR